MTKTAHRPCPVCGGPEVAVLHHQRFVLPQGHPLPSSYDVVACSRCDFVFADTTGTAADYDRYYAQYSKYADQGTATGGGGDAADQERLRAMAEAIAGRLPDKHARIVDIGCANGGLLGALKARGYSHLLGIDPSPTCVENARRLFDLPVSQGWLLALPPQAAPADLVIVSHVLEHVLDLRRALAQVRAVLSPHGLVYAEVPDAQRYVECLAAPFQDFNTEHINHFGTASLENLFSSCGLFCLALGRKTITVAQGVPYPAVFGFFGQASAGTPGPAWKRDPAFLQNVGRYIVASRSQLAGIDQRLAPVLGGPVIVWGTGQLTLKLLAETSLGRAQIAAFTDANPLHHGECLNGVQIVAPEHLVSLPPHPIVVGSLLHQAAIVARIRGPLGLRNPLVTLEPA